MEKRKWLEVPQPIKLSKEEKNILKNVILSYINSFELLKNRTKKIEIKAGRVYLYEYYKVDNNYGVITKPLIDGKYLEMPYARITLYDKNYKRCSTEYQQYNGKWFTLSEGTLQNCVEFIEENGGSFY